MGLTLPYLRQTNALQLGASLNFLNLSTILSKLQVSIPATHVCTEKHLDNLTELYDCMQWQNHTHVGDIHSNITHQNNTQAKLLQLICRTLLANSIKPTLEVETTRNVDCPGNILECHWVKQTAEQEISQTDNLSTSRSHSQSDIAHINMGYDDYSECKVTALQLWAADEVYTTIPILRQRVARLRVSRLVIG